MSEPSVTSDQAHLAKSPWSLAAPYWAWLTRLLVISKDGSSAYSISATSGAPVPALSASAILTYSADPAPMFWTVTQTPGWVLLYRVASRLKPGTQAHTVSFTSEDLQPELPPVVV